MTLSIKLPALLGALALTVGTAFAAETPGAPATVTETPGVSAPAFPNPFDPSTWMTGPTGMNAEIGKPEAVNMAHPAFWMSWADPKTHQKRHMQFMNPAMYAQFMTPSAYAHFANPANWMAWMDPSNYAALTSADTYAYWMNPGSSMHAMDPAMYMQSMNMGNYAAYWNPALYMQWMNPAAYVPGGATDGVAGVPEALNPAVFFANMFGMGAAAR